MHPDSLFESIPQGFFDDSAKCNECDAGSLFIYTRIDEGFFPDADDYSKLRPQVQLRLKPDCSPGIVTDICGNNAVGREYHGFNDIYLTPLPLDVEEPYIKLVESTLTGADELKLYFRVFDKPDCYASGLDSILCKLVNNTKALYDTVFIYPPTDSIEIGDFGPNLVVSAADYSLNDELYYELWAWDVAENCTMYVNTLVRGSDSDRPAMVYPSPWLVENQPLFLQYYIDKNAYQAKIYVYNNNGDLAADLSSDWVEAVILGPIQPQMEGFHRYRIKSDRLTQLPTGVYVMVVSLPPNGKIALPLNILHTRN